MYIYISGLGQGAEGGSVAGRLDGHGDGGSLSQGTLDWTRAVRRELHAALGPPADVDKPAPGKKVSAAHEDMGRAKTMLAGWGIFRAKLGRRLAGEGWFEMDLPRNVKLLPVAVRCRIHQRQKYPIHPFARWITAKQPVLELAAAVACASLRDHCGVDPDDATAAPTAAAGSSASHAAHAALELAAASLAAAMGHPDEEAECCDFCGHPLELVPDEECASCGAGICSHCATWDQDEAHADWGCRECDAQMDE
jgi:hypothetical protein